MIISAAFCLQCGPAISLSGARWQSAVGAWVPAEGSTWGHSVARGGGWVSQMRSRAVSALSWVRRGGWMVLWSELALRHGRASPEGCSNLSMEVFHHGDKTIQLLNCFCSVQSFWCGSIQLNTSTPGKTAMVHVSNWVWSVTAKNTKLCLWLVWTCFGYIQTAIFAFWFAAAFHKEKSWKISQYIGDWFHASQ